jgi:hypothetical protein
MPAFPVSKFKVNVFEIHAVAGIYNNKALAQRLLILL